MNCSMSTKTAHEAGDEFDYLSPNPKGAPVMNDLYGQAVTDADLGSRPPPTNLIVTFYLEAVQDLEQTAEQGRPIFQEREHIRIQIPGNLKEIRERQVRPSDLKRFPVEYAAF